MTKTKCLDAVTNINAPTIASTQIIQLTTIPQFLGFIKMKEAVCIMTMTNHLFLPIRIKRAAQKLPPLKLFQRSCNESSWLVKATAAINRCQALA